MAIEKQHLEFEKLDLNEGWEVPQGYPVGIEHKILSGIEEIHLFGNFIDK